MRLINQNQTAGQPTWGELCLAINEGQVPAQLEGDCYTLRRGDLLRWLRDADEARPTIRSAS